MKTILNYMLCCLLNAWVLDGLLEDRIPQFSALLFVPCPMSISAGSAEWPGHVPCVSCRGGNFTCSAHPESPTAHSTWALSGFVVTPVSWSAHLGGTHGCFMAFFVCVCSQNKQGCLSRGWMCEWWWDKDMETLNRKCLGLSGNVCSVIHVQVAQIQRLLVRFCLI